MVLDTQRKNVDPLLTRVAKHFTIFDPNTLTWISLVFAFIAGVFFFFSDPAKEANNYFLYAAALFVFLNGFFDAIDGKVAKLTNKTSVRGDYLDHAIDRYADVFMVGGLALSAWCTYPAIGLLALVGMLLTSYMGTQAQAVGHKRDYAGILGRADRLVLLMFAPILQHIFLNFNVQLPYFNLLSWVLIYFAVMGNLTAIQRFISTLRWFKKK